MSGPAGGLHGWLIIDKPVGPTSARVVGMLKRALRAGGYAKGKSGPDGSGRLKIGHAESGRLKIGHGGTLDPLASGVLPIALGEATKLTGYLLNGDKSYRFTVGFGVATDSDDAEGRVVAESPVRPSAEAIADVLPAFAGVIRQRPPAFSALKVDGERAYRLARAGAPPVLAEREVTIRRLVLVGVEPGEAGLGPAGAVLEVRCSKGTYVRSLARDIALALGTVGHVTALRRTACGPFGEADGLALDKCMELVQEGKIEQALLPLMAGLDDIPVLAIEPHEARALAVGQRLMGPREKPGHYIATLGSVPVALVAVSETDVSVIRGFNL